MNVYLYVKAIVFVHLFLTKQIQLHGTNCVVIQTFNFKIKGKNTYTTTFGKALTSQKFDCVFKKTNKSP